MKESDEIMKENRDLILLLNETLARIENGSVSIIKENNIVTEMDVREIFLIRNINTPV